MMIKKLSSVFNHKSSIAVMWYFATNLFLKALAFITIPIFTYMLSPTEYGALNTYNAWLSIATFFVGFSLHEAIRGLQKETIADSNRFQSAVLFLSLLCFLAVAVIAIPVSIYLNRSASELLILLTHAYGFFIISFASQELLLKVSYKKYAFINILPPTLALLFTIAIFSYFPQGERQWSIILPRVIFFVLMGAGLLVYILFRGKLLIDFFLWKRALCYSLPLVLQGLFFTVMTQADRIILKNLVGLDVTGIYGFTFNYSLAIQIVWGALDQSWQPTFIKMMREKSESDIINQQAEFLLQVFTLFVIGFIFVSPEIMCVMASSRYWGGRVYILPLVLSALFHYMQAFPLGNEYYEGKTAWLAWFAIIAAVFNIIINLLVIPHWRAIGAAYTMLATFIVYFALHWLGSRKLNPALFPLKMYRGSLAVTLPMVLLYFLIADQPVWRWVIITVFTIAYSLWLLKQYQHLSQLEKRA